MNFSWAVSGGCSSICFGAVPLPRFKEIETSWPWESSCQRWLVWQVRFFTRDRCQTTIIVGTRWNRDVALFQEGRKTLKNPFTVRYHPQASVVIFKPSASVASGKQGVVIAWRCQGKLPATDVRSMWVILLPSIHARIEESNGPRLAAEQMNEH
jgi:hypothetical protein